MAHCAELIDGVVTRVIVVDNEITDPAQWCIDRFGGKWLQTSYTGKIRGKFAGIGDLYDEMSDEFVPPPTKVLADGGAIQPFDAGTL